MNILLDRKWKANGYTIGKLYINGVEFSDTLEDKDRGLKDSMSLNEITSKKVYGQTAIPTGTYEVLMTYSSKFANRVWGKKYKGKVPQLINVFRKSRSESNVIVKSLADEFRKNQTKT